MRPAAAFAIHRSILRCFPVLLWAAFAGVIAPTGAYAAAPADHVDPFIGTGATGNCYPGAQAPFGMISWSPNTTFENYDDSYSRPGYKYDRSEIYGFALTHISGVGCHAAQDMPIMPVLGDVTISPVKNPNAYKAHFSHAREEAHPGYYRVYLEEMGTDVQLAVSERAGLGSFAFDRPGLRSILFRPTETVNHLAGASIRIDPAGRKISGWMQSGGFCGRDPLQNTYTLFFHAEFNQPVEAHGFWRGANKLADAVQLEGTDVAAYLTFKDTGQPVEMRIGLSYVSEANAKANLEAEIPDWNLTALRTRTGDSWNKLLGRVEIEAAEPQQTTFYTALYHNLLQPSLFDDVGGQYVGFDHRVYHVAQGRHKYVNFSNWDTYRTSAQIQGLLFSEMASDMVNSLLLDVEQGAPRGFPNWGYFNNEANVMNGYSGIPFAVNAWAFGGHDVDVHRLGRALVNAADNCYDRGQAYEKTGYVPSYESQWNFSVSMTLEYSIADFCVARFCEAAGDLANASRFLKRSHDVFNLFDPESHYLRPRLADGSWLPSFSPTREIGFNEGNSAQYTWSTPHDMARLVAQMGGPVETGRRLDFFLSKILVQGWNTDQPHFWPSNEPCFGVPYLYSWIGQPWKTQEATTRIRRIFSTGPDGIPGDDDVGATSAYYLFNLLGLYPSIPGVGGFVVSSPGVSAARLHLRDGKTLVLRANGAVEKQSYIDALTLNGRQVTSSWIYLDELTRDKTNELVFSLRDSPNPQWASDSRDFPPSF